MAAKAPTRALVPAADRRLRDAAAKFLAGEGVTATVWRVEANAPAEFWILYVVEGEAFTAIAVGPEPPNWTLHLTLDRWPVP